MYCLSALIQSAVFAHSFKFLYNTGKGPEYILESIMFSEDIYLKLEKKDM